MAGHVRLIRFVDCPGLLCFLEIDAKPLGEVLLVDKANLKLAFFHHFNVASLLARRLACARIVLAPLEMVLKSYFTFVILAKLHMLRCYLDLLNTFIILPYIRNFRLSLTV